MVLLKHAWNLSLLIGAALSQTDLDNANNYWVTPKSVDGNPAGDYSKDQVYSVGENINLQWMSNFTSVSVSINQDVPQGNAQFFITAANSPVLSPGPGLVWNTSWIISLPTTWKLSDSNAFWFTFWDTNDSSEYYLSHYINITDTPSSTSTQSSATTPTSSSSTIFASSTAVSSGTSTATPVAQSSGGLSNGAKIGLGVGVSLGAIFLVLVGAGIWLCARKRSAQGSVTEKSSPVPQYTPLEQKPAELAQNQIYEMPHQQGRYGSNEPYELPERRH